jgi:hypothetical protein
VTSGYVPLFGSLTTGTLCGRWPDIGLWPIVLSLSDRNGMVDVTPDYLGRVTGLAVPEVEACMARFCEPDLYSRSPEESGARLVLLDPAARNWGWRIVNHAKYREKARKAAYDADRTASGRDAERKRAGRASGKDVPQGPDVSRELPLSDSDQTRQDTDKNTEGEACASGARATQKRTATRLPEDWHLTPERRQVAISERVDPERTHLKFCDHWRAASGTNARKHDWDAAWRNWCRREGEGSPGRVGRRPVTAAPEKLLPDSMDLTARRNLSDR